MTFRTELSDCMPSILCGFVCSNLLPHTLVLLLVSYQVPETEHKEPVAGSVGAPHSVGVPPYPLKYLLYLCVFFFIGLFAYLFGAISKCPKS
jgi:hypothetical protein